MSDTPSNGIPRVPENTTDPAAGLNLALEVIDTLLQLRVEAISNSPPGSAADGERRIVGTSPSGPWAAITPGKIARYNALGDFWLFYDANYAVLGGTLYVKNASNVWAAVTGGGGGSVDWGAIGGTLTDQTDLAAALGGKEPTIAAGTAGDYWTGSKTWADLATAVRGALLAGLSLATSTAVAATDTVLEAIGKLQAQVSLRISGPASSVDNGLPLFDGVTGKILKDSGTVVSTAGRALLDDADNTAQRATLGLGTFATAAYAEAPFVNLMPDSGRFTGKINPLGRDTVAAFTATSFLSNFNGASQASGGKFIHDNSTNGGAAGALTTDVQDLLAAMGRASTTARFGVEFYIDTITAGAGTSTSSVGLDAVTRYLLTINGSKAIFASSSKATFVGWIRAKSGSAHIPFAYYKNGSLVPAGTAIGSSFVHVRFVNASLLGYENAFPNLYAAPASEIQLACLAFYSGVVDTGIHVSPLPTINELSA